MTVDKPGRRLYNIRGPTQQEALSVLLQVDAADGNKVVTVRSPLQVRGTPRPAPLGEQKPPNCVSSFRSRIILTCLLPS